MSVLYGESNSGKTFVALDMAFHIATGRPWAGMKTARKLVIYVGAEGGRGLKKRVAALRMRYADRNVDLKVLRTSIDLLRTGGDVEPLVADLRPFDGLIGLVVIDTLSRALAGGDENSSTDMGAMVKHLDAIRNATGAHLLVVHHSGKNPAKGARGHSLLRAATDTEIEIADGQITVTKQRDLERNFRGSFVLDPVVLGVDGDGDPISSATVRLLAREEAAATSKPEPTPEELERRRLIALAAYRALNGASENKLTKLASPLVAQLKAVGIDSGMSMPTIRSLVINALGSGGIEIEKAGQSVRVEARQEGKGAKAPWMVVAMRVAGETKTKAGTDAPDNLSDGGSSDENDESGGVFL